MSMILFALLPMLIHEGGHYLVASFFGKRLHFKFSWGHIGKLKIPRWVWKWPQGVSEKQLRAICQAGFAFEFVLLPFMPWTYQMVALIHFTAYPWYANGITDLEGMI